MAITEQPERNNEVVKSSEAFVAPEINAFGKSFRKREAERCGGILSFEPHYQTYDYVKKMREEYKKLDRAEMSIWECCELLNEVVDESDPDLDAKFIICCSQPSEEIRKDYPDEDWLHLTAPIHDLGKVLLLPKLGGLPQWSVVGYTHPLGSLGCTFDESIVHHKYFKDNPDSKNPAYNTKNGVYSEGCGLENVMIMISWGHDHYIYMVAKENGATLPELLSATQGRGI